MVSGLEVRRELEELVIRDLLGPWEGLDEKSLKSPKSRYLVGMLAPIVTNPDPQKLAEEEDEENSEVATIDDKSSPSEFSVDDSDQDHAATGLLMHPSSMGLRCQVSNEVTAINVTSVWGRYVADKIDGPEGKAQKVYAREHIEINQEVDLLRPMADYDLANGKATLHVEVHESSSFRILEIALINQQRHIKTAPVDSWMFQAGFRVFESNNSAVFMASSDPLLEVDTNLDSESKHLTLLYRDRLEYAVGRACSTMANEVPELRRATEVRTEWLPMTDIPQTRAGSVEDLLLGMKKLANASSEEIQSGLSSVIPAYRAWISSQELIAKTLPDHLADVAMDAVAKAKWTLSRLEEGLALLAEDSESGEQARLAFGFMNQAMHDQRIRSEIVAARTGDTTLTVAQATSQIEALGEKVASWRLFQIAFILKQIPSLVNPAHALRGGDAASAELLFFPTGGGKTEAYLGLAAFTFAIRRLQGVVQSNDGPLDGGAGVAVLMRYTLRLLTSQQFVRATTLVCAAENIRKSNENLWGIEPFRIGLWVGSNVTPKKYEDAKREIADARSENGSGHGLTVLQVKRCPWCGEGINPKTDIRAIDELRRIYVHCGDILGKCEFSKAKSTEGLPLLTVDEEIYRFPPTFLLATVDKLARLAREGQAASLFGYVRETCQRHGYRHADSNDTVCGGAANHQAKGKYPPSQSIQVSRLRPPDLVIQDELHLITGSLGTAVGLFESVVDVVCSWTSSSGDLAKPLIVASTATSRNAESQIRRLYGRNYEIFPPQVIDVADTFFSNEVEISEDTPGRRYLGVCAPGVRMVIAQIQIFTLLQLAAQKLLDEHGEAADAYMTLVGYFNATRELAGMRRHVDDSVTTAVSDGRTVSGLPRRTTATLSVGELTSRISSSEIGSTLDRLGITFDPEIDSTAARMKWAADAKVAKEAGKSMPPDIRKIRPFDVVLATSMLQVGVDVSRLGLMLIVGQPKNTAEYIQASSRVGRSPDKHGPGLVLSLANWARPRDMAHFEQFDYYHRTFYRSVEALSVTPFSDASLERGLTAVLVSAARILDASHGTSSLSPNDGAQFAEDRRREVLNRIMDSVTSRSANASQSMEVADRVRAKLISRIDNWVQLAEAGLMYQRRRSSTVMTKGLLISPEEIVDLSASRLWRVANSMREVQPEINIVTKPSRMAAIAMNTSVRKWRFNSASGAQAKSGD